jgi:hypothetical protein
MRITRTVRRHTVRVLLLAGIAAILMGCSAVPNLDQGGMGCQNAGDGSQHDGSPTDPGQPLAGVQIVGRSAADVGREAEAKGLIVRYHLSYATTNDGGGYVECCVRHRQRDRSAKSSGARVASCSSSRTPR